MCFPDGLPLFSERRTTLILSHQNQCQLTPTHPLIFYSLLARNCAALQTFRKRHSSAGQINVQPTTTDLAHYRPRFTRQSMCPLRAHPLDCLRERRTSSLKRSPHNAFQYRRNAFLPGPNSPFLFSPPQPAYCCSWSVPRLTDNPAAP